MAAGHSRMIRVNSRSLFDKNYSKFRLDLRSRPHIICLSISTSPPFFRVYRPSLRCTKPKRLPLIKQDENEDDDDTPLEENVWEVFDKKFLISNFGHQVFVIQPCIKFGPNKKTNTTPELQLMESVTLIKTLRHWKVVDKIALPVRSFRKNTIFRKGNLKKLKNIVDSNSSISAVFMCVNTLTMIQQSSLQQVFKLPVFDRYSVIMLIFKEHAQSKEAKLQVQLAQLTYVWPVLGGFNEGMGEKLGVHDSYVGGEGLQRITKRKEVLRLKEAKLRKEILELREMRQRNRERRKKSEIPVVAVVGYTNAGKTSLIKALTGKNSLQPEDYLFATLDVTSHLGVLPSGLKVFFIDTLGFISDMPTYLIESFVATMEDATLADVIIHVRDLSHPDKVAQNDKVIQTLKELELPESTMKNIITVGNKIDLVEKEDLKTFEDMMFVSCTNFTGIDVLRMEIEKRVLMCTDHVKMVIRVESGGEEYMWLSENSTMVAETVDETNQQYTKIQLIITQVNLAKFKHKFITNYKR